MIGMPRQYVLVTSNRRLGLIVHGQTQRLIQIPCVAHRSQSSEGWHDGKRQETVLEQADLRADMANCLEGLSLWRCITGIANCDSTKWKSRQEKASPGNLIQVSSVIQLQFNFFCIRSFI
jgi:hypothetical protein